MLGLHIHTSNRLENLARQITAALEKPLALPLASETIVVQSRGMSRWLSLRLAEKNGVCMNCDFVFPREFVERVLRTFFPGLAAHGEFSTDALTWKIFGLLPSLKSKKEFALIKQYLADDNALRTFQLAEKIAHLFDQYLVYRPFMLTDWEHGADEKNWQSALWRRLVAREKNMHLTAAHALLEKQTAAPPSPGSLPSRVSLFGISSLPPFYIRAFFELAKHCEVNFFLLHPCREYYAHDLTPKRKARLIRKSSDERKKIADYSLTCGNPLLTSLGKLNRDFIESLLEIDERAGFLAQEKAGEFIEPERNDALAAMQRDVLTATQRGGDGLPKLEFSPSDSTIQIHSCHSPMREVEVLHDRLLSLFENDPSLRPRDILVMMPDIERYAPFIEAVFRFPEKEQHRIPFSVADRRPRSESGLIETFLALLALPGSRCTATEIFSLLDRPAIRRRFGFDDNGVETIRRWIADGAIRWGIDAAHRARFELPYLDANTWRAGLRRLLLGLATPGGVGTMFDNTMPCDEVEGDSAELLGRFISAVEALFDLVENLPGERKLSAWADAFADILDNFFYAENTDDARDARVVQTALDRLRSIAGISGDPKKTDFVTIRHYFSQLLDDTEQHGGFLTGDVTFCALKPMRSIPARIVCLLGMSDQDFPRRAFAPAFDLMASKPECGDRSPRDDDRYSFLEAILSARERLHISFVGRSVIDNSAIPPSVLVSELLDCIDQTFDFRREKNARAALVVEHRLHAFSPLYFDGSIPCMFSYSEANAAASRSLREPQKKVADFFSVTLPESDAGKKNLALSDLVQFFCAPQKYFLTQRLGIRIELAEDVFDDNEPFGLDNLERYEIKQELVSRGLEEIPADAMEFAARGLLPLGKMGAASFFSLQNEAEVFRQKVAQELDKDTVTPLPIHLHIGDFFLSGIVESIYENRLVQFRCAKIKPKDRLRAWIHHLAKCAVEKETGPETLLIGEDETIVFSPVKNAHTLLEKLLGIYWRGLVEPAAFFAAASFAYAKAKTNPSSRETVSPMQKAENEWRGNLMKKGERDDPYCAFYFADKEPLDEKFAALALEVFEPMLRHSAE